MLQLKAKRGQILVQEKIHFATPGQYFTTSRLSQPSLLLEQLERALAGGNWHGRRACLAMDSRACYMRTVNLPQLKKRELKQAMLWEAKKHLPFNADEAVVSFMPIGAASGKIPATVKYLLAAAPKETADLYTSLASKAGLVPLSLETPPTAWLRSIARLPGHGNSGIHQHRLIIDCGYNSTLLLLTLNHRYCFHRVIHPGIKQFIQAARAGRSGGLKESLRLIYTQGSLAEKGLLPEAVKMVRSIKDSLGYWAELGKHDQQGPINPVALLLSGGGALIPGLALYLHQELGLKTMLLNPFTAVSGSSNEDADSRKNLEDILFSTAHGLALRGWLK